MTKLRLVVPLTTWQQRFVMHVNKVRIRADAQNGLTADSAADFMQVRAVSTARFRDKLGVVASDVLAELVAGIALAVDYVP